MKPKLSLLERRKSRRGVNVVVIMRYVLLVMASLALAVTCAYSQDDARRDSIEVQNARNKNVRERGKKAFYNRQFDLHELPSYKPEQQITGTIRIWGLNYLADGNLRDYWDAGFRKYHPNAKIVWDLSSAMSSTSALVTGV